VPHCLYCTGKPCASARCMCPPSSWENPLRWHKRTSRRRLEASQPCLHNLAQHSFRACHARHGTRVSESALRRTRQYSRRYSTTTRPRSPARCRTTSATSTSAGLREYSSSSASMLVQAQQRAVGSEAARVEPRRAPTAIWICQRLNTFVLIQHVQ